MDLRSSVRAVGSLAVTVLAACGAPDQRLVDRTAYAFARDSAFARTTNRGEIAFTLPEKDLLAENVAHDPRDGAFYVGSTRHGKIVRRDRAGTVSDFVPSGTGDLWMVIGMKVDTLRGWLWVNTSAGGNFVGHDSADAGRSALVRYDLRTGRLLKRYAPSEAGGHFFNDLVLADDGTVFITDMAAGAVYSVDAATDSLSLWARPDSLTSPNGITLSGDGRTIYLASRQGINALDRASKERRVLAVADSIDARGIDGLYWYRGSLIGVQGGRRNRVQRFTLAADGASITAATPLEVNHPMFMNPTTGVIVGGDIYVLANSQFDSINDDGVLLPRERLFETIILRVPID